MKMNINKEMTFYNH